MSDFYADLGDVLIVVVVYIVARIVDAISR